MLYGATKQVELVETKSASERPATVVCADATGRAITPRLDANRVVTQAVRERVEMRGTRRALAILMRAATKQQSAAVTISRIGRLCDCFSYLAACGLTVLYRYKLGCECGQSKRGIVSEIPRGFDNPNILWSSNAESNEWCE
jgi:hydrogenase maturation factor HypF (carbamoyltransferase family)